MLLDAVLDDREFIWLGPSADKLSFFASEGNEAGRLRQEEYPHICFGEGPTKVARYFPDKLPIRRQAVRLTSRVPLPGHPAVSGRLPRRS